MGVTSLLDQGVNIHDLYDERTPLHYATREGHFSVIQLLIDRGSDVNAKKKLGMTPLWVAVYNGQPSVVQLLIDRGSDVDAKVTHWREHSFDQSGLIISHFPHHHLFHHIAFPVILSLDK
eukprot:TRINITY_DN2213_c0_g2_i1.p1 TRINITY_DN2213_c0_g2~~TRINITY_DN2213_c0_g2_i1.p1  ORF type:complete len:120 (-),score=23.53 TRINITY_DN2213_c0_g2_i1:6-365(-)